MPNDQNWTVRDVRFDEYGRIVMSERFAEAFRRSLRINGRLAVHGPGIEADALWDAINRNCPPGPGPGPGPVNMCDCEFGYSWFNTGRPMPARPKDTLGPGDHE